MSEEDFGSEKEIRLDEEYSIRKDYRSWTLIFKKAVKSKKNPSKMTEHYEPLYFPTLAYTLQTYVDKRAKKAGSIPEALAEIRAAMERIEEIFKDVPHALSKLH